MANRDYIVFDFETGSRNPHKTQPTQIAALALDGRNLSMKGTFNCEIRPILNDEAAVAAGLDPIEDGALKVTGKNRKDLMKVIHYAIIQLYQDHYTNELDNENK